MRHTINLRVEVEADTSDRRQVVGELLTHITELQSQLCESCEVLPGGREVNHKRCTLSVASASADGATTTAGWAVPA